MIAGSRRLTGAATVPVATASRTDAAAPAVVHVEVLIVGAGISGIGAACHLTQQCPGTTFLVLEAQDTFGGTWHTHRYPGARSDSDLHTFGYRFKPWIGPPIASAAEILEYLGEVIDEHDLARHVRYRHRIRCARWSSATNRWSLDVARTDTGASCAFSANFLWMCQGYYSHARPYTPDWAGREEFLGRVVHPQTWPDDVDCRGREVVVIGSGATAATLIPAIARESRRVTMLQRSPTYFIPGRNAVAIAEELRELGVDETWIHEIVRRKLLREQSAFTARALAEPDAVRAELIGAVRTALGPDFDVDTHFTPRYRPWRQRIAFVPDGDLFAAIRDGHAAVVTGEIERFVASGIRLRSGEVLPADIVVTATGFDLCVLGDIEFSVDGRPLALSDSVSYRGMMFTGVPNLVWVFGYFRFSWTLRADLIADFTCRLLNHMRANGFQRVVPTLAPADAALPRLPWIDPDDFNPGYVMRGLDRMPKRIDRPDWRLDHDYWTEKDELQRINLADGNLVYA
jgi:cation diffusion facilitator CzcD-associated flavoprotein CzcO